MRTFAVLAILMVGLVVACGCTLSMDEREHAHAIQQAADVDARLFVEDLDLLIMAERPTRLGKYHMR